MNVKFDRSSQTFCIELEGFQSLVFSPTVTLDGGEAEKLRWKAGAQPHIYQAKNRRGAWELKLKPKGNSLEISLRGDVLEKVDRAVLTPAQFDAFQADHVLLHGRKMGGCESYLLREGSQESLRSDYFMAITRNGFTLQLSHPLLQKDLSGFSG